MRHCRAAGQAVQQHGILRGKPGGDQHGKGRNRPPAARRGQRRARARRRCAGGGSQRHILSGRIRQARPRPGCVDDAGHRVPHRLDDQGGDRRRGHAVRRARASWRSTSRPARSCPSLPNRRCSKGSTPTASRSCGRRVARSRCGMLLTHTAGFVYHVWNAQLNRYVETTGFPTILSGKLAALNAPLAFEPGERWEYGINIDWAGRMVETVSGQDLEAYMRENIFAPARHARHRLRAERRAVCALSRRCMRASPTDRLNRSPRTPPAHARVPRRWRSAVFLGPRLPDASCARC